MSSTLQVAACADQHICARKETDSAGNVVTSFVVLDSAAARNAELSAMYGSDIRGRPEQ